MRQRPKKAQAQVNNPGKTKPAISPPTDPVPDQGESSALEATACKGGYKIAVTPQPGEDHYRALFESLDDGFCVIEKVIADVGQPLNFRYIEVNPAFLLQTGVGDPTTVVGNTIRQLFPDLSEDWYLSYDSVLQSGMPIRFERELVPRQRWLELSVFPIAAKRTSQLGILFKDITQRVVAEEDRRATEAFTRSIIASSPDCIKILDLHGQLLSFVSDNICWTSATRHPC